MSAIKKSGPTLQHFLMHAELVKSYRAAVRATRPLPDSATRRETLDWLRGDLERLRLETDLDKLRSNLQTFNRNLKIMIPSLSIGGMSPQTGAKLIGGRRST